MPPNMYLKMSEVHPAHQDEFWDMGAWINAVESIVEGASSRGPFL
jgi:hypothetical protein